MCEVNPLGSKCKTLSAQMSYGSFSFYISIIRIRMLSNMDFF